ncbi:hypothetical protein EVB87_140 [Rhizobium phage RHph_N28_1]|nr:hypothetical protein EVB87_140 [Rhizobium phage RHph_N28_1]QIG74169.1 hypothetical protein EVC07_141 [Rhizobium phage RHph_N42]QIG74775.1 hypothetical protein EVC12_140 [Rhizobium phage RHph_I42]QXV73827.1 hypothetical protein [Rhizobium phage RHph_N46]QXV74111.1 hypothetical protein [Rhizobium phage RHEph12]
MNTALLALLELAAGNGDAINENLTIEEQFPELVAPLMRYEQLLKDKTDEIVRQHTTGVSKTDLAQAKAAYDKSYLMSLPIPYSGIQKLCQELLTLCRFYKVDAPQPWKDYADGVFNWEEDIGSMQVIS